MRLTVTTPTRLVVDDSAVVALSAEDETGCFAIWPRHADFLTALLPSVVSWRQASGREQYCAVHGGLLTVAGGARVAVTTRQAIVGDDLGALEAEVRRAFAASAERESQARSDAARLHAAAIRRILGYARPHAHRPGGP